MQVEICSRMLLRRLKFALPAFAVALACSGMAEEGRATFLIFTMEVCETCEPDFHATWEGKDYGALFLAEKLEQYGLKGTFFVNPLCPSGLVDTTISNLGLLHSRGHDLELHPHPDAIDPSRPILTMYSTEERKRILSTAINIIRRAGAPFPIAYRAADYSIDRETLRLLPEFGIGMDSSIFPGDSRTDVQLPENLVNRFVKIEGVRELPITIVRRVPLIGFAGMVALDIDKTIWVEQQSALRQIAERGLPVATYFINFTSFFRRDRSALPSNGHKAIRPNQENIGKLENVLKLVTSDKRFIVITARELWLLSQDRPQELEGPPFVPYTGLWLTYLKAWKHFSGHSMDNKMVAIAPIVLIITLSVGAMYLIKRRRSVDRSRSER